jgi:hypothetical protein
MKIVAWLRTEGTKIVGERDGKKLEEERLLKLEEKDSGSLTLVLTMLSKPSLSAKRRK